MNIFRAADQTWGSSVEILYPYTISHLLTYEKPHMKTISIVGHSDHHTDIVIELALKFDAICIYICTYSRNYHIRLLWSSNRYHDWILTDIWCHLCTYSRNYHIKLVWSSNRYHSWILTEIWCHLHTHSRNYHIRLVRSSNRYHR